MPIVLLYYYCYINTKEIGMHVDMQKFIYKNKMIEIPSILLRVLNIN